MFRKNRASTLQVIHYTQYNIVSSTSITHVSLQVVKGKNTDIYEYGTTANYC